jgi:hypothetical protein
MSAFFILGAIAISFAWIAAGISARRLARAGWRYHGGHIVTCPETQHAAGVVVNVWHAIATSLTGKPRLQLRGCSRWPERASCGQECLSQFAANPQGLKVQSILRAWHEGKCCTCCGAPVSPACWTSQPVLLTGGSLKEWDEIPVSQLTEVLAAAQPVCFGCYARQLTAPTATIGYADS